MSGAGFSLGDVRVSVSADLPAASKARLPHFGLRLIEEAA